jgi:hydrogenase small subunit
MKGSVLKTMKHLGVFPKEVPTGQSKFSYYVEAGFHKVLPTKKQFAEASK